MDEEEEGNSPDGGMQMGTDGNVGNGGEMGDDYEEIDYKICGELGKKTIHGLNFFLEEKNRALDEFAMSQTPEGAIQVRVQQLALCKVLVNIHKRDLFILVKAYTNLG